MKKKIFGFTLIELLIVVAIIAILAAIAVPNFLEAQVRSKVSRAKADMRSLATAIEAYATDQNRYPHAEVVPDNNGFNHHVMQVGLITTPIAYITSSIIFKDPLKKGYGYTDDRCFLYEYMNLQYYYDHNPVGADWFSRTYGNWRLACAGPDGWVFNSTLSGPDGQASFWTTTYDPTNGTVSLGDIYRTSRWTDMVKP